jgi:hypothetical protein
VKRAKRTDKGYELQPEHVEHFWSTLFAWQQRLSLMDWRITRSRREPAGRTLSEMRDWDMPQRQVSCRLKRNWFDQEPTEVAIEQTAVHEDLHVLLAPLIELCKKPGVTDDEIAEAEHAVINRLEKLLVPGDEGD